MVVFTTVINVFNIINVMCFNATYNLLINLRIEMADFLIENANGDVVGDDFVNTGSTRVLQVTADNFDGGTIQIQGKTEKLATPVYINIADGAFTANAEKLIEIRHSSLRAIVTGAGGSASNINVVLV